MALASVRALLWLRKRRTMPATWSPAPRAARRTPSHRAGRRATARPRHGADADPGRQNAPRRRWRSAVRDVPSLSVATIADLGRYPLTAPQTSAEFDPERVPVEFFDDLHTRRTVRSDDLDELAGSPSATSSRRCRPTGVGAGVHGSVAARRRDRLRRRRPELDVLGGVGACRSGCAAATSPAASLTSGRSASAPSVDHVGLARTAKRQVNGYEHHFGHPQASPP